MTKASPLFFLVTPVSIRMVVVFPAPLGPKKTEKLPLINLKTDMVDRHKLAKDLG